MTGGGGGQWCWDHKIILKGQSHSHTEISEMVEYSDEHTLHGYFAKITSFFICTIFCDVVRH